MYEGRREESEGKEKEMEGKEMNWGKGNDRIKRKEKKRKE